MEKLGHSAPFCTKIYYVLFPILRKTSRLHVITLSLFQFKYGQNLCCKLPKVELSHLTADISLSKSTLLIRWKKLPLLQYSFQSCFGVNIEITLYVIMLKGPHKRSLSPFGWASWNLAGMQFLTLRLLWEELTIRKWQGLRLHTLH